MKRNSKILLVAVVLAVVSPALAQSQAPIPWELKPDMMARVVADRPTLPTIQMDTLFIDSARIGELLVSRPRVIRATRSLIFTTTEVTADDRTVASASGVFKILKNDS